MTAKKQAVSPAKPGVFGSENATKQAKMTVSTQTVISVLRNRFTKTYKINPSKSDSAPTSDESIDLSEIPF